MPRHLLPWLVALGGLFPLVGTFGIGTPVVAIPQVHVLHQAEEKTVAGDDALVKKVRKSINEGISYLRTRQIKDGSWELGLQGPQGSDSGVTSLVLLAMLNAGVKSADPTIQSGLKYLRRAKLEKNYAVSLQTMVFCLVKEAQDRKTIQDNVKWLLASRKADGWGYGRGGNSDNSNTQYSLLALHEANAVGFKVDPKALKEIQEFFTKSQLNGGWGYGLSEKGTTITMTTAGLCNLVITGMDLARGKAGLRKDGSAVGCGDYDDSKPIKEALEWLGDAFPARITNANAVERLKHPYYALYGIERAGRITGQRYFGGHDWYEVGCRFLVEAQRADGSWASQGTLDHWPTVATSFSLLFLSRGRTPVLISKLAYGDKESLGWNNKRSDMKNLVEFASREVFKNEPLAWQAFDVRKIEANGEAARRELAAQLLQSPIVFFNGHDMAPRDKEAEILREYVANGGFIFAECCCGAARHPAFDRDFRQLMKDIFPDSKLTPLEPEHPVWLASGKFAVSPKDFPLEGIKLGCKTVVIYSPVPLAGYWEANLHADRDRGQKAFQLGANIIAYATGLEAPRPRPSRVEITSDAPKEKPKRGYLQVGQLRHEGDWQPAPKAMRNLMAEARKSGIDVVLKTEPVGPGDPEVLKYRFLYMHGRNKFKVDKEDLKNLHFNLTSGGLLLADACCGSKGFDAAFRVFIDDLFSTEKLKLEKIPLNDDLFKAALNGEKISQVRRRGLTDGGKRVDPQLKGEDPELEGVKFKGRWVVIYSRYDIGCALEKHASPECMGHDPASAMRLARAALLYALKR